MKVAFFTLGCKVNQAETEGLVQSFLKAGFTLASFDEICSAYIINTCAVTETSEKKCRQAIRRARRKNPNAVVAVTGCWAQVNPEAVAQMQEADIVTGTKDRAALLQLVRRMMREKHREAVVSVPAIDKADVFEDTTPTEFHARTRASIKVQDGCDRRCAYCIIPYARGASRSMDLKAVEKHVRRIVRLGFKEIVLTGIQVTSYGKGTDYSFLDLLRAVNKIPGSFRIRLGSLNPQIFDEAFTKEIATLKKLCPHFHISLQAGCDKTLRAMNRGYTCETFLRALTNIRAHIPQAEITTDVIVGFPGETEEDFNESLAFVQKCAFLDCHIFPYSIRKGTVAAEMEGQIAAEVKAQRARRMSQAAQLCRGEVLGKYVGRRLEVLFETPVGADVFEGYAQNYVLVRVNSPNDIKNQRMAVEITQLRDGYCEGRLIE